MSALAGMNKFNEAADKQTERPSRRSVVSVRPNTRARDSLRYEQQARTSHHLHPVLTHLASASASCKQIDREANDSPESEMAQQPLVGPSAKELQARVAQLSAGSCFALCRNYGHEARGDNTPFSIRRRSRRSLSRGRNLAPDEKILEVAESPRSLLQAIQRDTSLLSQIGGRLVQVPGPLSRISRLIETSGALVHHRGRDFMSLRQLQECPAFPAKNEVSIHMDQLEQEYHHATNKVCDTVDYEDPTRVVARAVTETRGPALGIRGQGHHQESEQGFHLPQLSRSTSIWLQQHDKENEAPLLEVSSRQSAGDISPTLESLKERRPPTARPRVSPFASKVTQSRGYRSNLAAPRWQHPPAQASSPPCSWISPHQPRFRTSQLAFTGTPSRPAWNQNNSSFRRCSEVPGIRQGQNRSQSTRPPRQSQPQSTPAPSIVAHKSTVSTRAMSAARSSGAPLTATSAADKQAPDVQRLNPSMLLKRLAEHSREVRARRDEGLPESSRGCNRLQLARQSEWTQSSLSSWYKLASTATPTRSCPLVRGTEVEALPNAPPATVGNQLYFNAFTRQSVPRAALFPRRSLATLTPTNIRN